MDGIPRGWTVCTVAKLGLVKNGRRLPAGYYVTDTRTRFPFIRVSDMRPGGVEVSALRYVPEEAGPALAHCRIFREDVFISVAGTIGIVGRVPSELDGANFTDNADRITALKCDPDYLMYYLMSHPIQSEIAAIRTVGAQPKLALSRIQRFEIRLPVSRHEQRAVAGVLSDSDGLIAALQRLIVKKEAIKQGLVQELLTGRTRLPGFEGEWTESTFDRIAQPSRARTMPSLVDPSLPLVELEHLANRSGTLLGISTAADAVSQKTLFEEGDVLFGKLRSYLRKYWLADRAGVCSTEIWVLKAQPGFASSFVRYIVESDRFITAASEGFGTHMPRADWNMISKLEMRCPAENEQAAIAQVLSDADDELAALRARLEKARAIKQGMMQELLTGRTRLPVPEQDVDAEAEAA
jgi:type I restriction enzyme S subunit